MGKPSFLSKEKKVMNMNKPTPACSECNTKMQWGKTVFEYRDDGIQISIPDVPAWVCPTCGEASFTPKTTDQLIETLRELVATAKRARRRQPLLREYLVKVA